MKITLLIRHPCVFVYERSFINSFPVSSPIFFSFFNILSLGVYFLFKLQPNKYAGYLRGGTTLSITTFSIMTLSISVTMHYAACKYAECRVLFIVMLSVIILNVVTLSVIMLNVVMLSFIMLNVIMLSVVVPRKMTHIQQDLYNKTSQHLLLPSLITVGNDRGSQQQRSTI